MKGIFLFALILLTGNLFAQQKEKIAVVDLEYILKKVPEYQEQNKELRKRAREWDLEIQKKKIEIKKQKEQLSLERPLLTAQIIEEKEEEIALLEKELLDYQHQHFGLDGDYFIQKVNLARPIQEKIYGIINEYAEKRKFDMVLDKSDDTNGLLFAKKGVDISDRIVREIERSLRKERLTKDEIAQLEAQDKAEDAYLRQRSKRDIQEERLKEMFEEGESDKKTADDPLSKRQQEAEQRRKAAQKAKEEAIQKRKEAIQKRKEEALKRRQEMIEKRNKAREEARKKREEQQKERLKKINAQKEANSNNSDSETAEDKVAEILAKRKEAQEKREKEKEDRLKAIQEAKEKLNKN